MPATASAPNGASRRSLDSSVRATTSNQRTGFQNSAISTTTPSRPPVWQGTGLGGWVTGNAVVTNSRSVYTGSGSDPTVLANLQGTGRALHGAVDTGKIVTRLRFLRCGAGWAGATRRRSTVSRERWGRCPLACRPSPRPRRPRRQAAREPALLETGAAHRAQRRLRWPTFRASPSPSRRRSSFT